MEYETWAEHCNVRIPSAAGMVEHWLGGGCSFAADRDAAEQLRTVVPECHWIAFANRVFCHDAMAYMARHGVSQFLDIGCGLLTGDSGHRAAASAGRIVYVDRDPVVVAFNVDVVRSIPDAAVFQADLGYPAAILEHHAIRTILDLDQPVGLLLCGVLPFLDETEAYPAIAMLRDSLAPGSYLAVSHLVREAIHDDDAAAMLEIYRRTHTPFYAPRSREQILHCFAGLDLLDPGLTQGGAWLPHGTEPTIEPVPLLLTGVARKPHPAS